MAVPTLQAVMLNCTAARQPTVSSNGNNSYLRPVRDWIKLLS